MIMQDQFDNGDEASGKIVVLDRLNLSKRQLNYRKLGCEDGSCKKGICNFYKVEVLFY